MIELVAKTLQVNQEINLEYALELLNKDQIDADEFVVPLIVPGEQNETTLHNHLKKVFTLATLDEEELKILYYFSLLPPFTHPKTKIESLMSHAFSDQKTLWIVLNSLLNKGWIRHNETNNSYSCHQLVQQVARASNEISIEDAKLIIEVFLKELYLNGNDSQQERVSWISYAEVFYDFLSRKGKFSLELSKVLWKTLPLIGKFKKASLILENSIELMETQIPEEKQEIIGAKIDWADTLQKLGDPAKSIEILEELKRSILNPNIDEIEFDLSNRILSILAISYRKAARFNDSLEMLHLAIDRNQKKYGDDTLNEASALTNIGQIYIDIGSFTQNIYACYSAMDVYSKALKITRKRLGEDHFRAGVLYANLGKAHYYIGKYGGDRNETETGFELLKKGIGIIKEASNDEHPEYIDQKSNLAIFATSLKGFDEAYQLHYENLELALEKYGENHGNTFNSYINFSSFYIFHQKKEEALNMAEKAKENAHKRMPYSKHQLESSEEQIQWIILNM